MRCDDLNGLLPRPSPFKPVHYDVELQPDIYRSAPPFPLTGHVSIHVRCDLATAAMTLNAVSLKIVNQSIAVLDGTDHQPAISNVRFTVSLSLGSRSNKKLSYRRGTA